MMRLDKFLCDMQLGSRSQVKALIKKGTVTVNGLIIKKPDFKLNENRDNVSYMGKTIDYQAFCYYMLNKPAGVVTSTKDSNDKTVMDLMAGVTGKNLFPVGRLDKDTEGLLLITNDGELAHSLLSPVKHVDKKYYVECRGTICDDDIARLKSGVDIGDKKPACPAGVEIISISDDKYIMELTITEGRFHQVKRMIAAIDGEVTYLKRLSMGTLMLDETLQCGEYRRLSEEEITGLRRN